MKNLVRLTILLCITAFASIAFSTELPEVVKWTQMPNMDAYSYAFSSENAAPSRAADDFECIGGEPVVAVRWWGSYYQPTPAAHFYPNSAQWDDPTTPSDTPVPMLIDFNISFYANVAAGVDPLMPWAHPGDQIYSVIIGMDQISEVLYGTVTHTSGVEQNVWEYYAKLPDFGFEQEEGATYWISIQAGHRDQEVQWGWQECEQPGWNADMVQNGYSELYWNLIPNKELAFQLITREYEPSEPASIFAVSMVVLGLFLRRRQK